MGALQGCNSKGANGGADLHSEHSVHHEGVTVAPPGEQLVHVEQSLDHSERRLQHWLVLVHRDKQRGLLGLDLELLVLVLGLGLGLELVLVLGRLVLVAMSSAAG